MPRPHIEFIHAQELDWQSGKLPGKLAQVECKTLSEDEETGACSTILRYPKEWSQTETVHLTADHEFIVLDGALEINGQTYQPDSYGYLPAGHTHKGWSAPDGAVVLTFFSATPNALSGTGNISDDAIPYVYLHDMAWTSADIDPDVQFLRIAHKMLRQDKDKGESTIILDCGAQTHPRDWKERALKHPCAEEMFLLSGDIAGERGVMHQGAYFWRPPEIWHGPFGSRHGNICVIRFMEGNHVNVWSDDERPFSLTPDYKPDLPEQMKGRHGQAFKAPTPY